MIELDVMQPLAPALEMKLVVDAVARDRLQQLRTRRLSASAHRRLRIVGRIGVVSVEVGD
jgi:hypothetical protein